MLVLFPLVQLPKKFRDDRCVPKMEGLHSVSISSTSEEVQSIDDATVKVSVAFPLVQLPKKFRAFCLALIDWQVVAFPLVQLPKKFRA